MSPGRATAPSALDLPPPFRLLALREVEDAFAQAQRLAEQEGAGTMVHVERFDVAEFAVVLEPAEPLRTARRAMYAGCAALADALAVFAPPERPIEIAWPGAVRLDGGLVGGARLAWPRNAPENAPPAWLVFGAMIRTAAVGEAEPGLRPLAAALEEEGFAEVGDGRLVACFARHLMAAIDAWQNEGFGTVAKRYLARLAPASGMQCSIDDNGDLLVARSGKVERRRLVPALAKASWFDPVTRGPRR